MWEITIFLLDNQFLLLVALTPKKFLSPLRVSLQEVSIDSLKRVEYDNFQAIILGDEERVEGKLHYVKSPDGTKGERLSIALDYLNNQNIAFDYIARFDDDDVFNPSILGRYKSATADCLADQFHAFYDLNSNRTINTKKSWLANTVLLKKAHALNIQKDGRTLIEQDHAEEWHSYFKDKLVEYALPDHPIYLRVLSPTSITAKEDDGATYSQYLRSFGDWSKPKKFVDFSQSQAKMDQVHQEFYPDGRFEPSSFSFIRIAKDKIKGILKKD